MEIKREYKVEKMSYPLDGVYNYNVQVWVSVDGGKSYWYAGIGKYCRNKREVSRFIHEYKRGHEI